MNIAYSRVSKDRQDVDNQRYGILGKQLLSPIMR